MAVKEWISWLKVIVIAIALAIGIRTFLFTPIIVDGPSMLPTLHNNDHIIVNKLKYRFGEPKRFDIVVFHASKQKDFIKRVIGLPGEHIEYKNEILYVNGHPISEPFIKERVDKLQEKSHYTHDFSLEDLPGGYEVIPEGYVLVLGDNRTNSTDSRMIGLVSLDQIVGSAGLLFWPFDRFSLVQ
jgi:signal peptidase I